MEEEEEESTNGGGGKSLNLRQRHELADAPGGVLCVAGSGARGPTLSAGGLRRERERTWLVGLWGQWGWNQVLTEIVN
jgi:hypothetical protein